MICYFGSKIVHGRIALSVRLYISASSSKVMLIIPSTDTRHQTAYHCLENRYIVPLFSVIPDCLKTLTFAEICVLRPLNFHYGGYQQKNGMCHITWKDTSVEATIMVSEMVQYSTAYIHIQQMIFIFNKSPSHSTNRIHIQRFTFNILHLYSTNCIHIQQI